MRRCFFRSDRTMQCTGSRNTARAWYLPLRTRDRGMATHVAIIISSPTRTRGKSRKDLQHNQRRKGRSWSASLLLGCQPKDDLSAFERTGGEGEIEALAVLVRPCCADFGPCGFRVAVLRHAVNAMGRTGFGGLLVAHVRNLSIVRPRRSRPRCVSSAGAEKRRSQKAEGPCRNGRDPFFMGRRPFGFDGAACAFRTRINSRSCARLSKVRKGQERCKPIVLPAPPLATSHNAKAFADAENKDDPAPRRYCGNEGANVGRSGLKCRLLCIHCRNRFTTSCCQASFLWSD